jgi:SAM-dependent methyltransferase
VSSFNDPDFVAAEYADERRLAARRRVWNEFLEGPSSEDVTLAAIAQAEPRRVLEVGSGWGELAESIGRTTGAQVIACDLSPRMVELARARGVRALVASAQNLPFDDRVFDAVVANAMLYHLPDLDRGLEELARVLTDDGRLVATTFGADHLKEVWDLVGGPDVHLSFSAENGEVILRRRFEDVEVRVGRGTVIFPDGGEVRTYVASTLTRSALEDRVPSFDGPFVAHGHFAVFVASRPRR